MDIQGLVQDWKQAICLPALPHDEKRRNPKIVHPASAAIRGGIIQKVDVRKTGAANLIEHPTAAQIDGRILYKDHIRHHLIPAEDPGRSEFLYDKLSLANISSSIDLPKNIITYSLSQQNLINIITAKICIKVSS